jgi:uncharacterized protein (DUF2267 family)
MADSVIKAVLGIFASRLHEEQAQHFTERLPDPLTFERLHSHQVRPITISFDQYVTEIAQQFNLNNNQARLLISEVLHDTKEELMNNDAINEVVRDLPDDWARFFDNI